MSLYDKNPVDVIADIILAENEMEIPVSASNIKLSKFIHNETESKVTVDGVRYSELRGFRDITYHRISLETFFKNVRIQIRAPELRNSVELLPYIKRQFGLDLSASDIVLHQVQYNDPEDDAIYECKLEIVANHPLYKGMVQVSVVGIVFDLSEMFKVVNVNGIIDSGPRVTGKTNVTYITYGIDYSEGAATLTLLPKVVKDPVALTVDDAKTIARTLPGIDGLPWVHSPAVLPFNLSGASLIWNGTVEGYKTLFPTTAVMTPNSYYSHVMVIRPGALDANRAWANNWGYVIHYDIIERYD